MKSIREFIESKIRRAEVGDDVRLLPLDLPHAELGAPEGIIESKVGAASFYVDGFVIGEAPVRYDAIAEIRIGPAEDGVRLVDVTREGGEILRIRASEAGGLVVYDTLRWIGRAKLRRKWDREGPRP